MASVGARTAAVRVDGIDDLVRAFNAADRALTGDLKDALVEAAAPVRRDAQVLAPAQITRLGAGDPWARMRLGTLAGGRIVYMAPVERGAKGRANQNRRRRRFKPLLLRPMEQALVQNRGHVIRRLDGLLAEVKAVWERHG